MTIANPPTTLVSDPFFGSESENGRFYRETLGSIHFEDEEPDDRGAEEPGDLSDYDAYVLRPRIQLSD